MGFLACLDCESEPGTRLGATAPIPTLPNGLPDANAVNWGDPAQVAQYHLQEAQDIPNVPGLAEEYSAAEGGGAPTVYDTATGTSYDVSSSQPAAHAVPSPSQIPMPGGSDGQPPIGTAPQMNFGPSTIFLNTPTLPPSGYTVQLTGTSYQNPTTGAIVDWLPNLGGWVVRPSGTPATAPLPSSAAPVAAAPLTAGESLNYQGEPIVIQTVGTGQPGLTSDDGTDLPIGTTFQASDGSIWSVTGWDEASEISGPTAASSTATSTLSSIPTWAWLVGGGLAIYLFAGKK